MLVTFILGLLAGWFSGLVEPRLGEGLGRLDATVRPGPVELARLALAVSILLAGLLATLLVHHPSPVALAVGACLGVLGPRLQRRWQARNVPDYDR